MLGWTAAFWVLGIIRLHLPGAVAPSDGAEVIISVVLFALVIFAALRLTIFLPAIAVDAPGASVRNVFADTGGHAWLIVKAYFVTVLPFILLVISIAGLAWLGGAHDITTGNWVFGGRRIFRSAGISDLDMLRNRLGPAFHEDRRSREDWRI